MSTDLTTTLVDNRARLEAALPSNIAVGDFVRLTLTEVQKNPDLMNCDPQSVFLAVMEAARLGVVPGDLGRGWLIARKIKGRLMCNFQPGYRLFVDLARRSGEVVRVEAHVVYEEDDFQLRYGTEPVLLHQPSLKKIKEKGDPVGAYAVAHLKGGGVQVEFMDVGEIEQARAAGAANSPAWTKWWGEMAKKVVIKRASKLWPLSVDDQRQMSTLVGLDNTAEGFSDMPEPPEPAAPLSERVTLFTEEADDAGAI